MTEVRAERSVSAASLGRVMKWRSWRVRRSRTVVRSRPTHRRMRWTTERDKHAVRKGRLARSADR